MSAKQDRVYTRTAEQLKREINFGESFAEVMGIATDARDSAQEAKDMASNLDSNLTSEEIFNRLTNNGQAQGLYRGPDGELYINASYIMAGILASLNNKMAISLETGEIVSVDDRGTMYTKVDGGTLEIGNEKGVSAEIYDAGFGAGIDFSEPSTGNLIGYLLGLGEEFQVGCYDQEDGEVAGHTLSWKKVGGVKTLVGDADTSGKKVLYDGAVTAGGLSFTVNNTADYDLFMIWTGNADSFGKCAILAYKVDDVIRGIGGWAGSSSAEKELYFVSATFSGDTWTLLDCNKQSISANGTVGVEEALWVRKVIGII